jgi:maleamate amidohydrolase
LFGTSLAATVRGTDTDTVIVVGAGTSAGIRATAIDLLQHGFVPVVVADAVTDDDCHIHTEALRDLGDHYADIVMSTTVADAHLRTDEWN